MTDDLVTFLRARYDEDAALAAEATQDTTGRWTASETDWGGGTVVEDDCGALILPTPASRVATHYQHIARHDPARVLAEVNAKRELISDLLAEKHEVVEDCWYTCAAATEEHDGGESCDDNRHGGPCDCGRDRRVHRRLRLLALPHADHPGYLDKWRT